MDKGGTAGLVGKASQRASFAKLVPLWFGRSVGRCWVNGRMDGLAGWLFISFATSFGWDCSVGCLLYFFLVATTTALLHYSLYHESCEDSA